MNCPPDFEHKAKISHFANDCFLNLIPAILYKQIRREMYNVIMLNKQIASAKSIYVITSYKPPIIQMWVNYARIQFRM